MNWDRWSRNRRWPGKALLIYVVGHERGYGGSGRRVEVLLEEALGCAGSRSPGHDVVLSEVSTMMDIQIHRAVGGTGVGHCRDLSQLSNDCLLKRSPA